MDLILLLLLLAIIHLCIHSFLNAIKSTIYEYQANVMNQYRLGYFAILYYAIRRISLLIHGLMQYEARKP